MIDADDRNLIDVHIGERINLRRRSLALSVQALADLIDVTPAMLDDFERGVVRVGSRAFYLIAGSLEVPVSYFFDGVTPLSAGMTRSAAAPQPLLN